MAVATDATFWIAFSAGALSFFSPCVLPLIPSYITYLTGLSFDQIQDTHPGTRVRLSIFLHSLVFGVGFSCIFISFGILAGVASSTFQQHLHEGLGWVQKIGGILVFLFGIHVSGLFRFNLLLREKRIQVHRKPSTLLGTFLVGVAFAVGWTPCIGPILFAILALAAGTAGSIAKAIVLLTAYSVGMGVPFLISGLLFHRLLSFSNRLRKHLRTMEILTGGLLMMVGTLLFFNLFSLLSGYLHLWLPVPSFR